MKYASDTCSFITISDLRVRYKDSGIPTECQNRKHDDETVPTFLLIHGFLGCLETWNFVSRLLRDRNHRVISLDLVGCGFSDKPSPSEWNYSMANQGRMVRSFTEQHDLSNVILVAHSSGAIVAAYANDSNDRVLGNVFVAPGFFGWPPPSLFSYGFMTRPVNYLVRNLTKSRRKSLLRLHLNKSCLTSEIIDAFEAPYRSEDTILATVGMFRVSEDRPYVTSMHCLTAPSHIVWSEGDMISAPAVDKVQALITAGDISAEITTKILCESGHYIQHEQPARLVLEILEFAERLCSLKET